MTGLPSFLKKSSAVHAPIDRQPVVCGSFGVIAQQAPWAWSLAHDRDTDVLLWMTRGQGRVTIDGVRRGVSMNIALFLPAGSLFSIDLPTTANALYLQSPKAMTNALPGQPLLLRVRNSLAQTEMTGIIDAMSRELTQNRPYTADALEAHLRLVGVWLRRQVASGADEAGPDTAAVKLTRRYVQTLQSGYQSSKSMGDYARMLDVTPTHLTRSCKEVSGRTAADLLTDRKLHAARVALAADKPSVQDIAAGLGFASPAYFTRFVRTHTGHTPSALRKKSRTLKLRL